MNDQVEQVKVKKAAPEVTLVEMNDGRKVEFTGKRTMLKEIILSEESVAVRFDFRNGQTLTAKVPAQHELYAAGHGYGQKLGDEVAGAKGEDGQPISDEDKFLAIEALHNRLTESADWNKAAEGSGGSVSGASVVLKAIMEVSGKTLAEVKAFIDKKLAAAEASGQKLTRQALYASFRNPTSKTGVVIARLEADKKVKAPAADADALMSELDD
jgi:hypothetical protein